MSRLADNQQVDGLAQSIPDGQPGKPKKFVNKKQPKPGKNPAIEAENATAANIRADVTHTPAPQIKSVDVVVVDAAKNKKVVAQEKKQPLQTPVSEGLILATLPLTRLPLLDLPSTGQVHVQVHTKYELASRMPQLIKFVSHEAPAALGMHPQWLNVLHEALHHEPYALEAVREGKTVGFLPLCFVSSFLFGRYLVSMPYLNSNGVVARDRDVQLALISRAANLAEELGAKQLQLRQEQMIEHPRLDASNTSKVHMRMALPESAEALWKSFDPKVRNQIRKAEKSNFVLSWASFGREADHVVLTQLDHFYDVLTQNMRDLGTPFYSKKFFETILRTFPGQAEIPVLRTPEGQAVAAALLLHGNSPLPGQGITEVPSASSLREFNNTCVNMLLYRHLLERAIERKQAAFDFGRSTQDGPTFKFKKQWGAVPYAAIWQYASHGKSVSDARPDNPKFKLAIKTWQKLPVWLTRIAGPKIVRGIP